VLCDFGDAQFGAKGGKYNGEVMPDLYRAPEIVLATAWDEKIDIWSIGCMVWDLYEGKHLFTERLPTRIESAGAHLARMVTLLGLPPKALLDRGALSKKFLDDQGKILVLFTVACAYLLQGELVPDLKPKVQETSLEEEETSLEGEEKDKFLSFIRRILK
jgi:serine/threonine-protein kinase SRPK3